MSVTTLRFQVTDEEARRLRAAARRAKLPLGEYLRQKIVAETRNSKTVRLVNDPVCGVKVFASSPGDPLVNTETVKAMLTDFP